MNLLTILTVFGSISLEIIVSAGMVTENKQKQNKGLWATLNKQQPIIVAHRGEKVLMPQHTLASYEIAAIEGADYVEPDLVLTSDGKLVCFHDLSLRSGTDVADNIEFADRMGNLTEEIDGSIETINDDWFIHNFTLMELKKLRVKQVVRGIRPQYFNNHFEIPTFEEYLDVIHKMSYLQNRSIGVIPEIKNPKFHNSLFSENYMEDLVLSTLRTYGYPVKQADVPKCNHTNMSTFDIQCGDLILQSFDFDSIKYLHTQTNVDLLVLAGPYSFNLLTINGLKEVANVARYFFLPKSLLYTGIETALRNHSYSEYKEFVRYHGRFVPVKDIVTKCHDHNLRVGIYTIYDSNENSYRGCDVNCKLQNKEKEMFYFFKMGVDGFFVENIQEALALRMKFDYQLQINDLINSTSQLKVLKNSGNHLATFGGAKCLLALVWSVICTNLKCII